MSAVRRGDHGDDSAPTQDALPLNDEHAVDDQLEQPDRDDGRAVPLASFPTREGMAVEAITVDGKHVLWAMSNEYDWTDSLQYASTIPPAHERVGKLPREFRKRLGWQCTATTRSGARCKRPVGELGGVCPAHREDR